MRLPFLTGLIVLLTAAGCASGTLSSNAARQQIAEIQDAALSTDDIQIQRIVSEMSGRAVAEANLRMAFEFEEDADGEWRLVAARLGDGNWINLDGLMAAIDRQRSESTSDALDQLRVGLDTFVSRNGALPEVLPGGYVSDELHPLYMNDLIRNDAWGGPIRYLRTDEGYELRSAGADGRADTGDDIVRTESLP